MPLLPDRVVLISGGTSGLGAAIARAAAREGALVAVTGRRREPGEALAAELTAAGSRALFIRADIGQVEQARASVTAAVAGFGRVDSLVNAAGLTSRGTLLDTTPELFDAHIAVNLKAPFFLMQAVVADLVARKAPGTIVNIMSTSAHAGQPYLAPYVGAKAGASLPMGKLGQVGEIAEFVAFLLSDRSGVVAGSVIDWDQNVLGGMD